jgi:hypothetical protein
MKKIIAILFLTFITCGQSLAAITFTDGHWSTTFDCDEWTMPDALTCDDMIIGATYTFNDHQTQILSTANYSNGDGGRGIRFWLAWDPEAEVEARTKYTGPLWVGFPSAQQELWIRWYMRYQYGFAWSPLEYHKQLYIHTGEVNTSVIPAWYGYIYYTAGAQNTADPYQVLTDENYGWSYIMGGSTSDGQWHCYEIHIKMDTDQTNGIGQIWLDGILLESNVEVDWSDGDATAKEGWTYFTFTSNSKSSADTDGMYVDYDDITVYNTTPPNTDLDGNPFIGPIGGIWTSKSTGISF